jgi:hypothetical protein
MDDSPENGAVGDGKVFNVGQRWAAAAAPPVSPYNVTF